MKKLEGESKHSIRPNTSRRLKEKKHRSLKSGQLCPETWFMVNKKDSSQKAGIPYCTSHDLRKKHPQIDRVVIVQHGRHYNPITYFNDMTKAAELAGKKETTLILAPQVVRYRYIKNFGLDPNYFLQWNKFWVFGTRVAQPFYKSVFDLYDDVLKLLDQSTNTNFPNLKNVVIAGHSAGGQFVQRFALASAFWPKNFHLRYIIMNPSTYGYLAEDRPYELTDVVKMICPQYNNWGYGLAKMWSFNKLVGGPEGMRENYRGRDVVYLLGDKDTKGYGESKLDSTCPAALQGPNRFARGMNYYKHIQKVFGTDGKRDDKIHRIAVVPDAGHKQAQMFQSPTSLPFIFGDEDGDDYIERIPEVGRNGEESEKADKDDDWYGDDWYDDDANDEEDQNEEEDENEMIEGDNPDGQVAEAAGAFSLMLEGPPRVYNHTLAADAIATEVVLEQAAAEEVAHDPRPNRSDTTSASSSG